VRDICVFGPVYEPAIWHDDDGRPLIANRICTSCDVKWHGAVPCWNCGEAGGYA